LISRLVTVDLVLTTSERLHRRQEYSALDLRQLYTHSTSILNHWAKAIETRGLSCSLGAIVENAFLFFEPGAPIDSLRDIGNQLIEVAGQIEHLLSGERSIQPFQVDSYQEFETALEDEDTIEWFTAAKEITDVVNATNASESLKACLAWLPNYIGASAELRKKMDQTLDFKKPIPKAFVALLRDRYYHLYKALKGIQFAP
jgi:hypothetical protein